MPSKLDTTHAVTANLLLMDAAVARTVFRILHISADEQISEIFELQVDMVDMVSTRAFLYLVLDAHYHP